MEKSAGTPNILRLEGIRLADHVSVEDLADARLLEEDPGAELAPDAADPPGKIPRVFTRLEDWPHRTNLRCWSCDFTFDDRPKFVATYAKENENGSIEFGVEGNMCTFNCAEQWIETRHGGRANNEDRWKMQNNLCLVYFMFTGVHVRHIKPAPSKTLMKKYGGELDEDAFWKLLRELDPVAGLKDHTAGSVLPERLRVGQARVPIPEAERTEYVKTVLKGAHYRPVTLPASPTLARPAVPLAAPRAAVTLSAAPSLVALSAAPPGAGRAANGQLFTGTAHQVVVTNGSLWIGGTAPGPLAAAVLPRPPPAGGPEDHPRPDDPPDDPTAAAPPTGPPGGFGVLGEGADEDLAFLAEMGLV